MKDLTRRQVLRFLKEAKDEDFCFSDGRVLGSMCTQPLDIARVAHGMFLESNLGNPGLYPGTKRLEKELIGLQAALLHGRGIAGHAVGGGTEANITALWMARNASGKKEVVFPKSAHFSVLKACDLLAMRPVVVGLDGDYRMDVEEARRKIGKDTAAVVAVAGTTELGMIDPIEELGELCGDTFLHVDAAFGGYVIPFLGAIGRRPPEFDFKVPGVCSIGIDAHKMGMATIPAGSVLMRRRDLLERITFDSPYLTMGELPGLSGTRCSAGVASAYAAMKYLGRKGYARIVKDCMGVTEHLVRRCVEMGLEPVVKPVLNIACLRLRNPGKVFEALNALDWRASLSRNPRALRLVVMPHVTRDVADDFSEDLEKVCKRLGEL